MLDDGRNSKKQEVDNRNQEQHKAFVVWRKIVRGSRLGESIASQG